MTRHRAAPERTGEGGQEPRPACFVATFSVAPSDIDDLGHVNNLVYVRWVQDVARAHWQSAARAEDQAALAWVVVRHEIDYLHPAVEGDEITVRTWVETWRGATSDRHTEIERSADGTLLARARTVWCALDVRTWKPKRLPRGLSDPFLEAPKEGES